MQLMSPNLDGKGQQQHRKDLGQGSGGGAV